MSSTSVVLELNGKPLVVRNTFIDVEDVPACGSTLKRNSAPSTLQFRATTADPSERAVRDEPLSQLRLRLFSTSREGCKEDVSSCGDLEAQSHLDPCEVASIVSTKVPSEVSSILSSSMLEVSSSKQELAGLHPQCLSVLATWGGHSQGEETRGDRTTLMFRNLPESFTRSKLEELLNAQGFAARFDFLYMPSDLSSGACFGYAFVNMVTASDARSFIEHFQGFQQWPVPSHKRAVVHVSEELQGIGELIERYRNSALMHPSVPHAARPAVYCNGSERPFPEPTAPVKPPRTKKANRNKAQRQ